jgi:hypothetical protein
MRGMQRSAMAHAIEIIRFVGGNELVGIHCFGRGQRKYFA